MEAVGFRLIIYLLERVILHSNVKSSEGIAPQIPQY